ncbi:MAG: tRNA dihydrouridine synthase DusB [Armatimonadetes bacterium]|nr:tRNA dihydrouridine synthase DusB [Armatimonadota bacterium]
MLSLLVGDLNIYPPLVLAPMAGITNHACRWMCKQSGGCGLVGTEMVSAYALRHGHRRTREMLDWVEDERPVSVQIFGGSPEIVAEGARIVEEAGADVIEINMGCPAPKVSKTGAGAALLKDLNSAESIITAAVRAVHTPVMVKTRKGWDESNETAVELAKITEGSGGAAVTVHGRTVVQGYSGSADWDIIRRVRGAVKIPVIGNGDVRTPEDARRMFDETGCDGVMIGRGALGRPWIFKHVSAYLETGEVLPEPDFAERIEWARRHVRLLVECVGEERAVREMRGHIVWYIKGIPGAAGIRASIMDSRSLAEIEDILNEARGQCEPGIAQGR